MGLWTRGRPCSKKNCKPFKQLGDIYCSCDERSIELKEKKSEVQPNWSTRLQRILEETKEADGEAEIRERMHLLISQVIDSIFNLHEPPPPPQPTTCTYSAEMDFADVSLESPHANITMEMTETVMTIMESMKKSPAEPTEAALSSQPFPKHNSLAMLVIVLVYFPTLQFAALFRY
ncbi:hypothetical protein POM88_015155 [Heracleum sosnowskyi]|uniref:Uncharacterized protein n=1 Tax=Heracleum sosnowskyi TaxID=360622 RepID=A0AAD8IJL4_9APIA|nr:hypothetical protein POM88_015155 [Heracleum sosnowskyi]